MKWILVELCFNSTREMCKKFVVSHPISISIKKKYMYIIWLANEHYYEKFGNCIAKIAHNNFAVPGNQSWHSNLKIYIKKNQHKKLEINFFSYASTVFHLKEKNAFEMMMMWTHTSNELFFSSKWKKK